MFLKCVTDPEYKDIIGDVDITRGTHPQEPGDPRFLAILDEMRQLHVRKAADYGADEDPLANLRASVDFGIPAWLGTLIRANDKIRRLMTFAKKGELANESVIDSFNDAAAYFILARILYEETIDR